MWEKFVEWISAEWPKVLQSVIVWLKDTGLSIVHAVLLLIVGWWVISIIVRAIRGALKRSKADATISDFVCSCLKALLKIIVVVMAIATVGINVTSIITALGAAGITLGLAMQDSLSNFASGVLILFNKPFVAGDYIEVEDSGGTVKCVALMYTTLVNSENKEVIYPNSKMTAGKIINHTALSQRRLEMQFSVAHDSDIEAVKKSLREALDASPLVISEENGQFAPVIGMRDFGKGAITFDLRAWTKTSDYWEAYYNIEEQVFYAFARNGISYSRDQLEVKLDR